MPTKFTFLVVALSILAAATPVRAQPAKKMPLIGYLLKSNSMTLAEHFRQGLHDLGYVEGRNIKILFPSADGRPERFPKLVDDLIRQKVDVIVTAGGPPVRAAMRATRTIPIVVRVAGDFVALGYAKSLSRPGGNVTGLSNMTHDLTGKQLQIFKEAVPKISRVAILRVPKSLAHKILVRQAEAAAPILGVELVVIDVTAAADLPDAFRRIAAERADAILVLRSGFLLGVRDQIIVLARKASLPTMFGHVQEAAAGGLMAYGADTKALFRGAASYVDQILRGAKPADMPISEASRFNLTINLKTAKALGIKMPRSLLLRADKVIK